VTSAAHSVGAEESECESGAENESERDGEKDDDDSEDDLRTVGEQSGAADSTDASSAGTEAPAKKAKITLTEEQERFVKQFLPAASKVVRTCGFMRETYSDIHLEIIKVSLVAVKKRHGFRNRLKCHLL
jgi:hypothetical protein